MAFIHFLVVLLCTSALTGALANQNTWVTNDCDKDVVATTSYNNFQSGASSGFVNRVVKAGASDHDEYYGSLSGVSASYVRVEVWNDGAHVHQHVDVIPDHSVVARTASNGCCDWYRVKYGALHQDDGSGVWATTCP